MFGSGLARPECQVSDFQTTDVEGFSDLKSTAPLKVECGLDSIELEDGEKTAADGDYVVEDLPSGSFALGLKTFTVDQIKNVILKTPIDEIIDEAFLQPAVLDFAKAPLLMSQARLLMLKELNFGQFVEVEELEEPFNDLARESGLYEKKMSDDQNSEEEGSGTTYDYGTYDYDYE